MRETCFDRRAKLGVKPMCLNGVNSLVSKAKPSGIQQSVQTSVLTALCCAALSVDNADGM